MDKFDNISRYDTMNLFDLSLQVRQLLGDEETIFYSCEIQKFNRYGLQEPRIIIVTNEHIWTFEKGDFNYTEHRKVPIKVVNGLTTSEDPES